MIEVACQRGPVPHNDRKYGPGPTPPAAAPARALSAQRGAIAIMFALMVVSLIGIIGMALDLGMIYNRKAELQGVATAAALAAAKELNGTSTGVALALNRAADVANALTYQYRQQSVVWNDTAISFSAALNGPWLDAENAQTTPDGLLFAKVETNMLGAEHGTVNLNFMQVISSVFASVSTGGRAVAGHSTIELTPLAICALSGMQAAPRANPGPPPSAELVEYGFRRGVSYDLMNLNPTATSAENFVIDPIDPPGVNGAAPNTWPGTVGPFVCTGLLAMPRVTGAPITVGRPFPLAALYQQLNSRFDQYIGGLCNPRTAPPDTNIRSYAYIAAVPWMTTTPGAQTAQSTTSGGKLWTVADPLPAPAGNTAPMYGPLWVGARAVPYTSYTLQGTPEPATGYTPFATASWSSLYNPGLPGATASYPGGVSTPYKATTGVNFLAPSAANRPMAKRRVLNIPLLSCPVGPGAVTTATVLGIGKFLMTVPATTTNLYAEFSGLVPEQSLSGQVELYP